LFWAIFIVGGVAVVRVLWYALRRPDLEELEEPPDSPTT
jgi:hypothetical protein